MFKRLSYGVLFLCVFASASPSLVHAQTVPDVKPAPPPPLQPPPPPAIPSGWPSSISTKDGFARLGQAISREKDFPRNGSDTEKARYMMSRLPEIARSYHLSAGSGGFASQVSVGASRLWDGFSGLWGGRDPENAPGLKGPTGSGNCGEWSWAFSEMLTAVGVNNTVVFGDNNPNPGASLGHTGTDTAVTVVEKDPGGRVIHRIFDPYQAGYYNAKTLKPDAKSAAFFSDLPMTGKDVTDDDRSTGKDQVRWKEDLIKKAHIKEARHNKSGSEKLLEEGPSETLSRLARIKGMVFKEQDHTPLKGAAIEIKGKDFSRSLTTMPDGSFSTGLEPGDYEVTASFQNETRSMTLALKEHDFKDVEFLIPVTEETDSFYGSWTGTAKVIQSSDPKTVGMVQPYDIEIIPSGDSVVLRNKLGLVGNPAAYKTQVDNNRLVVHYTTPPQAFGPTVGQANFTVDVTARGDTLTGSISLHSTGTYQDARAEMDLVLSLNLNKAP